MAVDGRLSALFGLEDPIKETTHEAIQGLKSEGIKVVLLSGDNEKTTQAVADKLGIDAVYANILPDEKAKIVQSLQKKGEIVTMAGDGINDAPALAQADVGRSRSIASP